MRSSITSCCFLALAVVVITGIAQRTGELVVPTTASPSPVELTSNATSTASASPVTRIENAVCPEDVVKNVYQIYNKNRDLFDQCVREGKYQVFPFSGKFPTQDQILSMVKSQSCTALFTACVLANLPQCDIGEMALKSVTETLLKIAVEVDTGADDVPTSERFRELIIWRRDVNLAQQAGAPFDSTSTLYSQYSRNLWKALTTYSVKVLPDLQIEYELPDGTKSSSKRPIAGSGMGPVDDGAMVSGSSSSSRPGTKKTNHAGIYRQNLVPMLSTLLVVLMLTVWS